VRIHIGTYSKILIEGGEDLCHKLTTCISSIILYGCFRELNIATDNLREKRDISDSFFNLIVLYISNKILKVFFKVI
jgi:hypothetical protein